MFELRDHCRRFFTEHLAQRHWTLMAQMIKRAVLARSIHESTVVLNV